MQIWAYKSKTIDQPHHDVTEPFSLFGGNSILLFGSFLKNIFRGLWLLWGKGTKSLVPFAILFSNCAFGKSLLLGSLLLPFTLAELVLAVSFVQVLKIGLPSPGVVLRK